LAKWRKKRKEKYNVMTYPKLQVYFHEMLELDDLHLHLIIILIPCRQQSQAPIMPSGIATWQVRRKMANEGI
jgi:hypothetical protein